MPWYYCYDYNAWKQNDIKSEHCSILWPRSNDVIWKHEKRSSASNIHLIEKHVCMCGCGVHLKFPYRLTLFFLFIKWNKNYSKHVSHYFFYQSFFHPLHQSVFSFRFGFQWSDKIICEKFLHRRCWRLAFRGILSVCFSFTMILLLLLLKTCDLKLVIVGWWMFYDRTVKTIHESLRSLCSNMNLNHNSHKKNALCKSSHKYFRSLYLCCLFQQRLSIKLCSNSFLKLWMQSSMQVCAQNFWFSSNDFCHFLPNTLCFREVKNNEKTFHLTINFYIIQLCETRNEFYESFCYTAKKYTRSFLYYFMLSDGDDNELWFIKNLTTLFATSWKWLNVWMEDLNNFLRSVLWLPLYGAYFFNLFY